MILELVYKEKKHYELVKKTCLRFISKKFGCRNYFSALAYIVIVK